MPGRLEFSFEFSGMGEKAPRDRGANEPIRILLLADLAGRENRGDPATTPLSDRVPARVDIDNFGELLRRIAPAVSLTLGDHEKEGENPRLRIEFEDLDDFAPDALYQKVELFLSLRKLRQQLLDPSTYDEAAEFLNRGRNINDETAEDRPAEDQPPAGDGSTFEQLLGGAPVRATHAAQSGRSAIDRLLGSIVEPHIEKAVDPEQPQLLAAVDDSVSEQMRRLLHHPDFQALETAWRSVHDMVSSLETGEEFQIFLLDVTRSELLADFRSADGQLDRSALYQLLVERGLHTPGGLVWSTLVGHFDFGTAADDMSLLAGMGALASQAGAPFLAAAKPELLGCPAIHEAADPHDWQMDDDAERKWLELRSGPVAHWIGLAFPRVLARLPYGKEADEIDQFSFEEISDPADHASYLWGNPAVSCAKLAAMSWQEAEALCEPGDMLDISDLPAFTYLDDGQRKLLPCAEALLSERAAEHVANCGIMPVMSYRDQNRARLLRFQSIANPVAALKGAWR